MASVTERMRTGPITYEALTAVVGGQLVIPQSGATSDPTLQGVQPAGDAALNCVGVANKDAVPYASQAAATTYNTAYAGSFPNIDTSVPTPTVACPHDTEMLVSYTLATTYGAKLACAAAGAVRPWLVGDGPAAIVGRCTQPGGVASAGKGLAWIRV